MEGAMVSGSLPRSPSGFYPPVDPCHVSYSQTPTFNHSDSPCPSAFPLLWLFRPGIQSWRIWSLLIFRPDNLQSLQSFFLTHEEIRRRYYELTRIRSWMRVKQLRSEEFGGERWV